MRTRSGMWRGHRLSGVASQRSRHLLKVLTQVEAEGDEFQVGGEDLCGGVCLCQVAGPRGETVLGTRPLKEKMFRNVSDVYRTVRRGE